MKIAITGGIGSGKSFALKILKSLGYACISLDDVYNKLCQNESFVLKVCALTETEPDIAGGKKALDRAAVSKKVFNDKALLKKLDEFTHAQIFEEAFRQGAPAEKNGEPVFYEVPLLFEGNYEKLFDKVWVITRDKNARVKSAALRDKKSESEILEKIKNQVDYDNLNLSLHTIIKNDGSKSDLEERIKEAVGELEKQKTQKN